MYTNVNTPQNDLTWRLPYNITVITATAKSTASYTPDPNYTPQIVYCIGDPRTIYDINTLTTHQKMDVYIDRTTSLAYYVDCAGTWKNLAPTSTIVTVNGVIDHSYGSNTLDLNIVTAGNNKIPLTPVTDINTLL